jgi:AcrR family transcriptional regulator
VGRKPGSKNRDFDDERAAILNRLLVHVTSNAPRSEALTFRELARLAEVSPTALRHYFPGRDELLLAVMHAAHLQAAPHLEVAAGSCLPLPPLKLSLETYLTHFVRGFEIGVGNLIALGLAAGLGNDRLGPGFINDVLEPALQALEHRLRLHIERGDMPACEPRLAALSLLSPVLLALLHQLPLGGRQCRPLDVSTVMTEQVKRFRRAYGPAPRASSTG